MHVEVIIYIYGAICLTMIVFNIVYNIILKGSEPRMERRCKRWEEEIGRQIVRIQSGEEVEPSHMDVLRKKLRRTNDLIALSRFLQANKESDPALYQEYFRQIFPVVIEIAQVYLKKENMRASYFTYFLSCHADREMMSDTELQDLLLEFMKIPNLYCQFNALKALYHFADPEHVERAIRLQDESEVFLHEKIITEGLLSYTGDHEELIRIFWKNFPEYSIHAQLEILNYIRFHSGEYQQEMYDIMEDEEADKELRLSAIRYLGKYVYEPARARLLSFTMDKDPSKWEYATVAAASLFAYPGEDVMQALKEALHSSNWYVRYSAAQSLDRLNVSYMDMIDIMSDRDRYAREMMMYRLESRSLKHKET